jgi:Sugar transferases involved in lipopolysaccharide synthesis
MIYTVDSIYKTGAKKRYFKISFQKFIKRSFDIFCSLIAILIFLPVIVVIYFLIYAQRDGKVIFSQERIGKGGKPFNIYKFRTMTEKAEANGIPQLYCKNDSRLTKVGKFFEGSSS